VQRGDVELAHSEQSGRLLGRPAQVILGLLLTGGLVNPDLRP
jgi:hypothetical protein